MAGQDQSFDSVLITCLGITNEFQVGAQTVNVQLFKLLRVVEWMTVVT